MDLEWRLKRKMKIFEVKKTDLREREKGGEDKETRTWCEGKWKVLKSYLIFNPIFAKHAFFATQLTREWVAKWVAKIPRTQILKNFSKCFSRLGLVLASESRKPLDELATCEWVDMPKWVTIFWLDLKNTWPEPDFF